MHGRAVVSSSPDVCYNTRSMCRVPVPSGFGVPCERLFRIIGSVTKRYRGLSVDVSNPKFRASDVGREASIAGSGGLERNGPTQAFSTGKST